NVTGDRRVEDEVALDLAGLFNLIDLVLRDVPERESAARRTEQGVRAGCNLLDRARPERLLGLQRQEIFLLGSPDARARDSEEGIALLDVLPCILHEDFLYPAADAG